MTEQEIKDLRDRIKIIKSITVEGSQLAKLMLDWVQVADLLLIELDAAREEVKQVKAELGNVRAEWNRTLELLKMANKELAEAKEGLCGSCVFGCDVEQFGIACVTKCSSYKKASE